MFTSRPNLTIEFRRLRTGLMAGTVVRDFVVAASFAVVKAMEDHWYFKVF